jgi:hypothetical protein
VPCRLTRPPYSGQRRWTSNCLGSLDKIYLDAMELEISGGRCGESNAAGGARKGCMVMGGTIMHLNLPRQWATHGTPLQATVGGGGREPTACTICELMLTGFTPPPGIHAWEAGPPPFHTRASLHAPCPGFLEPGRPSQPQPWLGNPLLLCHVRPRD